MEYIRSITVREYCLYKEFKVNDRHPYYLWKSNLVVFRDKIVVITGGAGFIGVRVARRLLKEGVRAVRLLDQDDSALTFAYDSLNRDPRVRLFLGKVENKDRLLRAFSGADIVFHLAATKHVMVAEYNPFETISSNVISTQHVIDAALQQNVKKVIFSSSDKAVNPVNTYGASKLLGEKMIIAANLSKGPSETRFSAVRFGNVMGSRGSVLPRFIKQLGQNNEITVTKTDMTRFIMFPQDAVELLIKATEMAVGGEVFVLKMMPIRLGDLAELVLENYRERYPNAKMVEIGLFEGEKLYEELLSLEEIERTVDVGDLFMIIPSYRELSANFKMDYDHLGHIEKGEINSKEAQPLSKEELRHLLEEHNLFT